MVPRLGSTSQPLSSQERDIHERCLCKSAAESSAKFGTPSFSWPGFGSFYVGRAYVDSGTAILIDSGAQFANGFGAMQNVTAKCYYDLNADLATIEIIPR
jgi:hypothetical protein